VLAEKYSTCNGIFVFVGCALSNTLSNIIRYWQELQRVGTYIEFVVLVFFEL
jgi:hypothetical protein